MPVTKIAYTVVEDDSACALCGKGRTYTVRGPDNVHSSTSYFQEDDAEHEADILNAAYNAGYQKAVEEMPL